MTHLAQIKTIFDVVALEIVVLSFFFGLFDYVNADEPFTYHFNYPHLRPAMTQKNNYRDHDQKCCT